MIAPILIDRAIRAGLLGRPPLSILGGLGERLERRMSRAKQLCVDAVSEDEGSIGDRGRFVGLGMGL